MGINTNVHLVFIYVFSKKCIQLFLITDFCLQTARKTQPFVSNTLFAIRPYAYFFLSKMHRSCSLLRAIWFFFILGHQNI